jgi:hypothetical protein
VAGESEEITPTFPVRTGICNGPSTCPHSRAGMVLCDTLDSDVTSDVLPVYDAVHLGDAIVTPPLCKPWQREQLVVLRSQKCPEPFGLPVDLRVFSTCDRGFHYSWSLRVPVITPISLPPAVQSLTFGKKTLSIVRFFKFPPPSSGTTSERTV